MEGEQTNVNMPPVSPAPQMPPAPRSSSSSGPLMAVVVILVIVVLGGLYFWNEQRTSTEVAPESDATLDQINSQNQSDDTSSIEADLEATDIETIDSEINAS